MTTPLEARVKAGSALRVPTGAGSLRIVYDARCDWYTVETCGPDGAWVRREFYPRWDELRDEVDLTEAREETGQ